MGLDPEECSTNTSFLEGRPNKRARKRLRQQAERSEAEHRFRFGLLVGETLEAPDAFVDLHFAVVDVEVIAPLDGSPDNITAWLIFATGEEAAAAKHEAQALSERARRLLDEHGFPRDALASFGLRFASEPEIEAGGGRFGFFR